MTAHRASMHRAPGASVDELWAAYRNTGTRDARDELIVFYAPLVKAVAGRLGFDASLQLDAADVVSLGIVGLIDAIDRFDPAHGVKFETYAPYRIRGSIVDHVRSLDRVPRAVRRNTKKIRTAEERLGQLLGRTPTFDELARELELDGDQLAHMLADEAAGRCEPLAAAGGGGAPETGTRQLVIADDSSDPAAVYEHDDFETILARAIERLPERARLIIVLSFSEGLTLAALGEILNVTESRVCQLRSKALARLRSSLRVPDGRPAVPLRLTLSA